MKNLGIAQLKLKLQIKNSMKKGRKIMENEIIKEHKRAERGTHYARVLNHLKTYGEINSLEAIREFGNTRLSSTIYLLRQDGYNIETVKTEGKNRYGDTVYFATYKLKKSK